MHRHILPRSRPQQGRVRLSRPLRRQVLRSERQGQREDAGRGTGQAGFPRRHVNTDIGREGKEEMWLGARDGTEVTASVRSEVCRLAFTTSVMIWSRVVQYVYHMGHLAWVAWNEAICMTTKRLWCRKTCSTTCLLSRCKSQKL